MKQDNHIWPFLLIGLIAGGLYLFVLFPWLLLLVGAVWIISAVTEQ